VLITCPTFLILNVASNKKNTLHKLNKRVYINIILGIGVYLVLNYLINFDYEYFFSKKENFRKTKLSGLVENNLKQGEWKSNFETGELAEIINYKNDTLNGVHIVYEKNGRFKLFEKYKMGIQIDTFKLFSSGKLNLIEYRDSLGKLQGEFRIYVDGKISQIGHKKDGEFHGEFEFYDSKSGKIIEKYKYKNGEKSGTWLYFNLAGDTIKKVKY
jgi:antitoxin component YwqK of YwqJK toxin-antitoxin module